MARKFRPNPARQAILVALALIGLDIGYGAGYLFKAEPNPPPPTAQRPTAGDAAAGQPRPSASVAEPMMPAGNDRPGDAPHRAYEESLPKDILENGGLPPLHVIRADEAPASDPPADVQSPHGGTAATLPGDRNSVAAAPQEEAVEWAETPKPGLRSQKGRGETDAGQQTAALPKDVPVAEPAATAAPSPIEPTVDAGELPTWRRNAVRVTALDGPLVAIVIDDMGVDRSRSRRAWNLPGPLTLSFLTYAKEISEQMADARAKGHELMLHVPMEPSSTDVDPGPNVLISGMPEEEILANLNWTLDQAKGYVGINNHMGSRFTAELSGMTVVMETLRKRGLLFLDSVTSPKSTGRRAARALGMPFIARNIFLDHVDDVEEIRRRLRQTVDLARRRGHAVAIGHPRDATLDALEPWLRDLDAQGVRLAPLTAILIRAAAGTVAAKSLPEPAALTSDAAPKRGPGQDAADDRDAAAEPAEEQKSEGAKP